MDELVLYNGRVFKVGTIDSRVSRINKRYFIYDLFDVIAGTYLHKVYEPNIEKYKPSQEPTMNKTVILSPADLKKYPYGILGYAGNTNGWFTTLSEAEAEASAMIARSARNGGPILEEVVIVKATAIVKPKDVFPTTTETL